MIFFSTALRFMDFTPLIQFVGGVYLLLLYDKVFDQNPLNQPVTVLKRQFENLKQQYQAFIGDHDTYADINTLFTASWDKDIKVRFRRLNVVMLSFCVIILLFVGFESYDIQNNNFNYLSRVMACSAIATLYFVATLFGARRYFMRPYLWVLALLISFHFAPTVANAAWQSEDIANCLNNKYAVVCTIISLLLGFVFIAINWLLMSFRLVAVRQVLERLSGEINKLTLSLGATEDVTGLRGTTKDLLIKNIRTCKGSSEKIFETVISQVILADFDDLKYILEKSHFKVLLKFIQLRRQS